jgi:hypothetical protein
MKQRVTNLSLEQQVLDDGTVLGASGTEGATKDVELTARDAKRLEGKIAVRELVVLELDAVPLSGSQGLGVPAAESTPGGGIGTFDASVEREFPADGITKTPIEAEPGGGVATLHSDGPGPAASPAQPAKAKNDSQRRK